MFAPLVTYCQEHVEESIRYTGSPIKIGGVFL